MKMLGTSTRLLMPQSVDRLIFRCRCHMNALYHDRAKEAGCCISRQDLLHLQMETCCTPEYHRSPQMHAIRIFERRTVNGLAYWDTT